MENRRVTLNPTTLPHLLKALALSCAIATGASALEPIHRPPVSDSFDRPLSKCWQVEKTETGERILASDNGSLYSWSPKTQSITSSSLVTGQEVWVSELQQELLRFRLSSSGAPVIVGKSVTGAVEITSLSTKTGLVQWRRVVPSPSDRTDPLLYSSTDLSDRNEVLIGGEDGILRGVDLDTGILQEFDRIESPRIVISLDSSRLLFPSSGQWRSLDLDSFSLSAFGTVPERLTALVSLGGSRFAYADITGGLWASKLGNVEPTWRFKAGGAFDQLVSYPDSIIGASRDNYLYSFDRIFGTLKWKKRFNGRLLPMSISSHYAGVAVPESDIIDIIDLKNGKRVNQVTLDGSVSGLLLTDSFLVASTERGLSAYSSSCGNEKKPRS